MELVTPSAAAELIRQGLVVAYPTETVYGLGADPFSEAAIERLFTIKVRDRGKPVLLVVANEEQLGGVVAEISPGARACMEAFWPGPLSLIFPKAAAIPDSLTAGSDRICVRCTSSPLARELCLAFGGAITSSSANLSGEPPASSLDDIHLPGVAAAVDGGALPPASPSTVFDPDNRHILRPGAISEEKIAAILRHV